MSFLYFLIYRLTVQFTYTILYLDTSYKIKVKYTEVIPDWSKQTVRADF